MAKARVPCKRLENIHPAFADSSVTVLQARKQECKIEADLFSKRQKKQKEDDLSRSDKNVLCGVDSLAGRRLKYKIGEKDQPQEEQDVFERPRHGSIRVCHPDRRAEQGLPAARVAVYQSSGVLSSLCPLVDQPSHKE